ncbi:MAG: DMT family transporter [Xanthobacteraceae bacterium]|nr:DMT family transporter [Xanthobacteraceae bacterium]
MNLPKAFLFKGIAALLFALLSACVRFSAEAGVPLGQIIFNRAIFAIVPVLLICAWQNKLHEAVRTKRPLGHMTRGLISIAGMFLNFAALARLPLVDATAISFAAPFITVVLAALILREHVRIYRWTAVLVGFAGIVVMLWPYLSLSRYAGGAATAAATVGVVCGLLSAFTNAASIIQTRRLADTETTSAIVFYFSMYCAAAGLATLPFGWVWPDPLTLAVLVASGIVGGLAHIVQTASYQYAPASLVAPLDYTTMIWAFVLGYVLFGELPTVYVYFGALVVAGSGLFVLWRERQLGLRRRLETDAPRT